MGSYERKKPLGRPRCRWKNNIKIYLQDESGGWTGLLWLWIRTGGGLV
jgi:hypothetical protein